MGLGAKVTYPIIVAINAMIANQIQKSTGCLGSSMITPTTRAAARSTAIRSCGIISRYATLSA